MACYPISPRHARMILEVAASESQGGGGQQHSVLPFAVALAAALSCESPFLHLDSIRADEGREGDSEHLKHKRNLARQRQAHFRCEKSDALSVLRALSDYYRSGESDTFCRDNFLLGKSLREMADLQRQLARTLVQQRSRTAEAIAGGTSSGSNSTFLRAMDRIARGDFGDLAAVPNRPSQEAEALLRRAMAAGWADHVARRLTGAELVARLQAEADAGEKRPKSVRYQCAALEEEVCLHPSSACIRAAPDFAVYLDILQTEKRVYMTVVTGRSSSSRLRLYLEPCPTKIAPRRGRGAMAAGVLPGPVRSEQGPAGAPSLLPPRKRPGARDARRALWPLELATAAFCPAG